MKLRKLKNLAVCFLTGMTLIVGTGLCASAEPSTITLQNESSYQLEVSGLDGYVEWSIDDPSVATISEDGTITAVDTGETILWAKVGDTVLYSNIEVLSPSIPASTVASLECAQTTDKIAVVSAVSEITSNATFQYFRRETAEDGTEVWNEILNVPAYIGENGLIKEKAGDRKTPVGLYYFTMVMGIAENPGTIMEYHQIDDNDYWCSSYGYYNTFVDEDVQEHECPKTGDEHLIEYTNSYQYVAPINYNPECTYGLGSGIFLHCMGNNPYTAGCIAIDHDSMQMMVGEIDPNTIIIIDTPEYINNEYY